jgi:hypothetical protein
VWRPIISDASGQEFGLLAVICARVGVANDVGVHALACTCAHLVSIVVCGGQAPAGPEDKDSVGSRPFLRKSEGVTAGEVVKAPAVAPSRAARDGPSKPPVPRATEVLPLVRAREWGGLCVGFGMQLAWDAMPSPPFLPPPLALTGWPHLHAPSHSIPFQAPREDKDFLKSAYGSGWGVARSLPPPPCALSPLSDHTQPPRPLHHPPYRRELCGSSACGAIWSPLQRLGCTLDTGPSQRVRRGE